MSHVIKDATCSNQTFKSTPDTGELVPHVLLNALPPGASTEAKQDSTIAELTAIKNKIIASPATETTLANILAKLIAAPSTEAKQDLIIAALTTLLSYTDGMETLLAAIQNKIIAAPATEAKQDTGNTELTAIKNKLIAAPSTEEKQDTTNTELANILAKIIAAPSTEAKQDSLISLLSGIIRDEDTVHASGDKGIILFGIRSDSDAPTAANGNLTIFKLDEEGRLKVASKPASYPDVVGDITAIQASIGTPVLNATVVADVSRASNVMLWCYNQNAFSGINCSFEGSLELTGDTNWFSVQAVRSNANTIETTTGALSAAPAYAWELSVNALARLRVRCTARTSGTLTWRFKLGTYATEPIPAAQVTATQPISGTTTANLGTNGMSAFADSSTNLAASATFTGTSRDGGSTQAFARFVARAFANVDGTFRIEQSADNTNWRRATPDQAVGANSVVELAVFATARYHRVVYVNGAGAQTVFLINSAYLRI